MSQPKTIVLLLPNLAGGGAERIVLTLASALQNEGHQVHLVLLGRLIEHQIPGDLCIHCLTETGKASAIKCFNTIAMAKKLRCLLCKLGKVDLLASHLLDADRVARQAKHPNTWYCIHNTLSVSLNKMSAKKRVRRLTRYQRIYNQQNLIAVSQGAKDDLLKLGLTPKQCQVIYNPFNIEGIRKRTDEVCDDIPNTPYCIHIGRFCPQKRHDRLLAAFAKVSTTHKLVCLCEPKPELLELIEQYGLQGRVILPGFCKNPYPWLKNADLLILSSDHEGLPSVLIESLICGTPAVSTDCPSGPREILTGNLAQWLVPANNIDALANTVNQALKAKITITDKQVQRFSQTHAVSAYLGLC